MIKRFYFLHKKACQTAGLTVVIVCSIVILIVVYRLNHNKDNIQIGTQITEEGAKPSVSGIPGSEVKEHLKLLDPNEPYAIVVATEVLLSERKTSETEYLIYPLTDSKNTKNVTLQDGMICVLFGINYGSVFKDAVVFSTGGGSGSYYSISGFMEEDEYAIRKNQTEGTEKTVISREMFHVYDEEKSLLIEDDEYFEKVLIYDSNEKEAGCIYYPVQEG